MKEVKNLKLGILNEFLKRSSKISVALNLGISGTAVYSMTDVAAAKTTVNVFDKENVRPKEKVKKIKDKIKKNKKEKEKDPNEENLDNLLEQLAQFYNLDANVVKQIYNYNRDAIIMDRKPSFKLIELIELYIKQNNIVLPQKTKFKIGTKNKKKIENFKKTNMYKIYKKYGKKYGVDLDLLIARDMQESSLSSNTTYNPYGATGPSQIEYTLIGTKLTAYNYETNRYDTEKITIDKMTNLDSNIRLGTMRFARCLKKTHGNVYAALQWYNYGLIFKKAINKYAKDKGITFDDVLKNINDLGWQKYIDDIHYNPSKYIKNWHQHTYGDNKYYKRIMKNIYDADNVLEVEQENGLCLINLNNNQNMTITNEDNNYIAHVKTKTLSK